MYILLHILFSFQESFTDVPVSIAPSLKTELHITNSNKDIKLELQSRGKMDKTIIKKTDEKYMILVNTEMFCHLKDDSVGICDKNVKTKRWEIHPIDGEYIIKSSKKNYLIGPRPCLTFKEGNNRLVLENCKKNEMYQRFRIERYVDKDREEESSDATNEPEDNVSKAGEDLDDVNNRIFQNNPAILENSKTYNEICEEKINKNYLNTLSATQNGISSNKIDMLRKSNVLDGNLTGLMIYDCLPNKTPILTRQFQSSNLGAINGYGGIKNISNSSLGAISYDQRVDENDFKRLQQNAYKNAIVLCEENKNGAKVYNQRLNQSMESGEGPKGHNMLICDENDKRQNINSQIQIVKKNNMADLKNNLMGYYKNTNLNKSSMSMTNGGQQTSGTLELVCEDKSVPTAVIGASTEGNTNLLTGGSNVDIVCADNGYRIQNNNQNSNYRKTIITGGNNGLIDSKATNGNAAGRIVCIDDGNGLEKFSIVKKV